MNPIGLQTLLRREIWRFLNVPFQSLLQPLLTALLYLAVFGGALAAKLGGSGVSYGEFLMPGLIVLTLITATFHNCSTSLFVLKFQGSIIDLLVAPLSAIELIGGFVGGAVLRGLMACGLIWLISGLFIGFAVAHPGWALLFALLIGATFGLLGLAAAIFADKVDQLSLVPTVIITPLAFLGGIFYSASILPEPWQTLTKFNPLLYMIEGLRFGLIGVSDQSPWLGLAVASATFLGMLALVWRCLDTGYKLRR